MQGMSECIVSCCCCFCFFNHDQVFAFIQHQIRPPSKPSILYCHLHFYFYWWLWVTGCRPITGHIKANDRAHSLYVVVVVFSFCKWEIKIENWTQNWLNVTPVKWCIVSRSHEWNWTEGAILLESCSPSIRASSHLLSGPLSLKRVAGRTSVAPSHLWAGGGATPWTGCHPIAGHTTPNLGPSAVWGSRPPWCSFKRLFGVNSKAKFSSSSSYKMHAVNIPGSHWGDELTNTRCPIEILFVLRHYIWRIQDGKKECSSVHCAYNEKKKKWNGILVKVRKNEFQTNVCLINNF